MLSNLNRLKILLFLGSGERSVSEMEMALGIRQPTLSQQIGELRDAELIRGRRVAKSAIYVLTPDRGIRALHMVIALNDAKSNSAPTQFDRTDVSRGSQPAAVFAAVFAPNGEALTRRKHSPTLTYRSERP